jgi:hypothetical protein
LLSSTQETPAGEGCKTRIYAQDEEGNRTSLTAREPASGGGCATEGGAVERHTYDAANQLTDAGTAYDAFGNTTSLPASDAGGSQLTTSYYVDDQVYKQTQNGTTLEYQTDPEDRTRETATTTGAGTTKVISHYDGSGSVLSWTLEPTTGKWTRNIPGINGTLTATQTNATAPVLLLDDLQGNVVAEASLSETETKLLKTYNSTEYGVPSGKTAPPKYAWLGAVGLASELPSGAITQDGSTYIPQTGRPLQTGAPELPLPLKYYTPYEKPDAEGATWGPIAAALSVAESKQAEHAQELAEDPPGTVPSPEGEEGQTVLSEFNFVPGGSGAHVAGHIHCAVGEMVTEANGRPHESSHNPGFVNWVVGFACSGGIVLNLQMRLALFWEGELASETGYVPKGDTASAKLSVQAPCITGWYTGWYFVSFMAPPGYVGRTNASGWSKASSYITCRT